MPGRDVKHQGASEPSGFRQKFSRRSLGGRFPQLLVGPIPRASQPLAGPPPPPTPVFLQAPPRTPLLTSPPQEHAPSGGPHLTCMRISPEQNDADAGSARPTAGRVRLRRWCWPCPCSPRPSRGSN